MKKIKKLINEKTLITRVKELAKIIYEENKDEEVVFICTLKGAVFFTCDLLKNYKGDARIEFLKVSSYCGEESVGKIGLKMPISKDKVEQKNIILVEDIVDTGRTLVFLKDYIEKMNPKSLKVVSLLDKKERREVNVDADYYGFAIDDLFVVGYGLDYDQKYRNLPYIGVLNNK